MNPSIFGCDKNAKLDIFGASNAKSLFGINIIDGESNKDISNEFGLT